MTDAQYAAICAVIDSVKLDERTQDTDHYAGEIVRIVEEVQCPIVRAILDLPRAAA